MRALDKLAELIKLTSNEDTAKKTLADGESTEKYLEQIGVSSKEAEMKEYMAMDEKDTKPKDEKEKVDNPEEEKKEKPEVETKAADPDPEQTKKQDEKRVAAEDTNPPIATKELDDLKAEVTAIKEQMTAMVTQFAQFATDFKTQREQEAVSVKERNTAEAQLLTTMKENQDNLNARLKALEGGLPRGLKTRFNPAADLSTIIGEMSENGQITKVTQKELTDKIVKEAPATTQPQPFGFMQDLSTNASN